MADPKHLELLRSDLPKWNTRRESRGAEWSPILKDADLARANLAGVNLSRANLVGANLSGADLSNANFSEADLSVANLNGANLFSADLSNARLGYANLIGADLTAADLRGAQLDYTDLSVANLNGANLVDAYLGGASLIGADLSGADLKNAGFSGAILRDADLSEATVWGTVFGSLDFSEAKGLEKVDHKGPSIVGVDTLYMSAGRIPEAFLRGAGVPQDLIDYLPSLVGGAAIQFYSAFISYSSKDAEFAHRLHADLQAKGLRVWFAPEDLKIGDRTRRTIHEAIRLYDKLLVILTAQSVASDWVEEEVETALQKERRENSTVLFPIRLDESVMQCEYAWAETVRDRNIGDFREWQDHGSYTKALDRLLRDLRASEASRT